VIYHPDESICLPCSLYKLCRWTTRLIESNHSLCLFLCSERLCSPLAFIIWWYVFNCETNWINLFLIVVHCLVFVLMLFYCIVRTHLVEILYAHISSRFLYFLNLQSKELINSNLQKCCQFFITHPCDVDRHFFDLCGGGEVIHGFWWWCGFLSRLL